MAAVEEGGGGRGGVEGREDRAIKCCMEVHVHILKVNGVP